MDGNRRWAKEQNITSLEGHRAGLDKVKEVLVWAQDAGIKEVIFYAFSSENWQRTEEEVGYMLKLAELAFGKWMHEVIERDVRIRVIGERTRLPESLREKITEAEEKTKDAQGGTAAFAFSYGGRSEILSAINSWLSEAARNEGNGEQITEEELAAHMWSADLADPDLIIRTGGEKRLSNFLTWQSIYSELFFTDTKWPAFSKAEFDSILRNFLSRDRRLGK